MIKRLFDIVFSLITLILLLPFFVLISLLIYSRMGHPIFFLQERVGRGGQLFKMYKFRTMIRATEGTSLITIGANDARVTALGKILRRYKLDELPQFWNVFIGDMSIVGPRPEVKKYVDLYSEEQRRVLDVRPGISDYASILFANESELLDRYDNPEKAYIEEIMPAKLDLNLQYINQQSMFTDLKIIFMTLKKIIF
ncbi:MAG TPA: sugar transferase [Bacteroidia bacterium]|nr:sugar transferase [Bacteroidia bacterium]HNT79218.1 sugar transferase [Bacteroidia bacterium]